MALEYFTNGPPAFLKKANALVDACRRIPKPGAFLTEHDTPQGPVFNVVIPNGGEPIKGALQPGSDVSTKSNPKYTITFGTYGGVVPTISGTALLPDVTQNIITLGASDVVVYMQCDFTYDVTGTITIVDAIITSDSTFFIPTSTITPATPPATGGSGTLYQIIFGVTVTAPVGAGPYTIMAAPGVGGSQNFGVCPSAVSINGPWGV